MKRRWKMIGGLGALWAALALAGCVTTQDTVTTQQTLMTMQEQNQHLEQRVKALERKVQGGTAGKTGGAQSLADLSASLQALQVELGRLKGQVEEQRQRLDRLERSVIGRVSSSPGTSTSSVSAASMPSVSTLVTPPADPEKAQYSKALQLYQKKDYQGARREFAIFLQKFPKSDLADNAQFWIGESYLSQKRYREAIAAYQKVLDRYPLGNKVPAALLQQANAFLKMGDKTAARILYQRVIERYPDSPQARIAQEKLKRL